jgi:hypothetical protein
LGAWAVSTPDTIAAFRGSLADRIFARHVARGPIADEDVAQACREEIGAADGQLNVKLGSLALNRPSRLAPVLEEVGDLVAKFKQLPTEGTRSAEVSLEAYVGNCVTLCGRIDAVVEDSNGALTIVDWKTGSWLDDVEPQLAFYSMLSGIARGVLPAKVEAVSVRTCERVSVEPTAEGIAETAREVALMVDVLRSAVDSRNDVERRGGPHCRWCPLLESCTEGSAAVGVLTAH